MNYKRLGNYIERISVKNTDGLAEILYGINIDKFFMPSIANTIGTNMKTYKIIEKNQFAYGPVTSRNGDKISIALLENFDKAIVSQAYTVFEVIDEQEILPEYLMMWFRRPEFDRFARFKSHGSAREVFDWDELCDTELPIPPIEKQQQIVAEYNTVTHRIQLNEKINTNLEATAQALYKHWFVDFEFPVHLESPPPEKEESSKENPINSPPEKEEYPKENPINSPPEKEEYPKGEVVTYKLNNLPHLKTFRKNLRNNLTPAEAKFWTYVKGKQLEERKFRRQHSVGNYILDFYCPSESLAVELDGEVHNNPQQAQYDTDRDLFLNHFGIKVLRFENKLVFEHPKQVLQTIVNSFGWKKNHPAFQAPLLKNEGSLKGYKSSGGKLVYNEELDKEIPVGWSVKGLSSIAIYLNGAAMQKYPSNNNNHFTPVLKIRELNLGKTDENSDKASIDIPEKYKIQNGDVVFSWSGTLTIDIWSGGYAGLNQHLFKVSSDDFPKWYYYLSTKYYIEEFKRIADGNKTSMGHIKREHLDNSFVSYPNRGFDSLKMHFEPILSKIESNKLETQQLKELQNLLLAKMTQVAPKTVAI